MMHKPNEYTIYMEADPDIFERQCRALERNIPGLLVGKRLTDVDGSVVQRYQLQGNDVLVFNDVRVNAVYVKSTVALEPYFEKKSADGETKKTQTRRQLETLVKLRSKRNKRYTSASM